MTYFVHPQGICETHQVGEGTRIWAFTHVLRGAHIGRDCNVCDHVFIENDVIVGDRVTIKSGVQLWDGVRVEDDVFIGPNATFTNDRFPRSKQYRTPVETRICRGASLSANCSILPGLVVGRDAMIGAGAVVTHDVPARAIVSGNPARIMGYVEATKLPKETSTGAPAQRLLSGAILRQFPVHADLRGSLTVCDLTEHVPFVPKRFFTVYNIPGKDVRGEHAHRHCHQFLVCVNGSMWILLDNGEKREEFQLDHPSVGVYIPPMLWSVQYRHSEDAVLVVFASEPYDPNDYIRDYEEFLRLRATDVS